MSDFSEFRNLDRSLVILAHAMHEAQRDYARRPCAQTQERFAEIQARYKRHLQRWREAALRTVVTEDEECGGQEED